MTELLKGHSKVSLEALYPETSSLKIFEAQDFCELVSEDKESIGLNMSYQEIQTMNKEKFRNIVRNKTISIQITEEYKAEPL